jgi:hypothetical protein
MKLVRHVPPARERKCAYRALVGNPEGKRPLGRPRYKRENNIEMDLQEVGFGGTKLDTELAQNRDRWRSPVNAVMNLRFPQNAGNFLAS